jgi:hypothetical protein
VKITQEIFDKIFNLVVEIQKLCPDADTTSINMWLSMVAPNMSQEDMDSKIEP